MRMSQLFVQTWREAPNEARTPGFQFLVRAGFVRPLGGSYAWLPLGVQTRQRIEAAVGAALQALGAQPVSMPCIRATNQAATVVPEAASRPIRFRDHAQHEMMIETGHEAAILAAASVIQSYRRLPALLYESWQQFRDEEGGAGGLFGAREGRILDAFSLHADAAKLSADYERIRTTLAGVWTRWNLAAYEVVTAEDAAGQPIAHQLFQPLTGGEESVARCHACGYAADQAIARIAKTAPTPEALLPRQDVATPNCKTIAELASFLGIPAARTIKAIFLVANIPGAGDRFVFAMLRGDTALNEAKLKALLHASTLGPATEAEIRQAGAEPGYGSPVGLADALVVVDDLAARSPNLVAGANRPGYHALNINPGRDYQATSIADIAAAQAGSLCPMCQAPLTIEAGVTLAESWQAGDRPALALGATYLDGEGGAHPLVLGRYRIYVDRLMAAIAESHCDAHGIRWPTSLAPYQVHLLTLGKSTPEVSAAAEALYARLNAAGLAVLYDDRDERAGVKFNDADLIGAPLRVAVGDRGLKGGTVEVKRRDQSEVQAVALDLLTSTVNEALA